MERTELSHLSELAGQYISMLKRKDVYNTLLAETQNRSANYSTGMLKKNALQATSRNLCRVPGTTLRQ